MLVLLIDIGHADLGTRMPSVCARQVDGDRETYLIDPCLANIASVETCLLVLSLNAVRLYSACIPAEHAAFFPPSYRVLCFTSTR